MNNTFPIARATHGSGWIVALEIGLVAALSVGALLLAIFSGPAVIFWIVAAVLVAIGLLTGYTAYSIHNLRVEVNPREVCIRGDLYGRGIPIEKLQPEKARVVDLRKEPELKPVLRTNGIGLPGYQVGWFRLKDGEKALLYMTDESEVTYLPTTEGYALLLSMENAEEFLEALRQPARI
jgi:hypothetical protein